MEPVDIVTYQDITGRSCMSGYAHSLAVFDLGRAVPAEPIRIVDGTFTARGPGFGLS